MARGAAVGPPTSRAVVSRAWVRRSQLRTHPVFSSVVRLAEGPGCPPDRRTQPLPGLGIPPKASFGSPSRAGDHFVRTTEPPTSRFGALSEEGRAGSRRDGAVGSSREKRSGSWRRRLVFAVAGQLRRHCGGFDVEEPSGGALRRSGGRLVPGSASAPGPRDEATIRASWSHTLERFLCCWGPCSERVREGSTSRRSMGTRRATAVQSAWGAPAGDTRRALSSAAPGSVRAHGCRRLLGPKERTCPRREPGSG